MNPPKVAVPPLFVTVTLPDTAFEGTVTVIFVGELTVNVAAENPPIFTDAEPKLVPEKSVPFMII